MNNRIKHFFDRPDNTPPASNAESKPSSGKFPKMLLIADSWLLKSLDVFVGDTPGNLLNDLRDGQIILYYDLENADVRGAVILHKQVEIIGQVLTNGNEQQLIESLTKALAGEPFIGTKMILRDRWFLKASTHPMTAITSERVTFADCSKRSPLGGHIWFDDANQLRCGNICFRSSRELPAEAVRQLIHELQIDVFQEYISPAVIKGMLAMNSELLNEILSNSDAVKELLVNYVTT